MIERRFAPIQTAPLTLERRAEHADRITGLAAVFFDPGNPEGTQYELWDNVVERIEPGAFDRAIAERQDVLGLFNHDTATLLGRVASGTVRLSADPKGLAYEIDVDDGDPDHVRVAAKLDRGDLTGSSFSFRATKVQWEITDDLEIRRILEVDLFDVGPVSNPAYKATTAGIRQAGTDFAEIRAELEAERARRSTPTPDQAMTPDGLACGENDRSGPSLGTGRGSSEFLAE